MLTDERIERYARHILLREVGGQGQLRLLGAAVEVDHLSPPVAWAVHYLALAGIGSLLLRDPLPCPAEGLLPLVAPGAAGSRAEAAARSIQAFNPDVAVEVVAKGDDAREPDGVAGWSRIALAGEGARVLWLAGRGDGGWLGWGEAPPCARCLELPPVDPSPEASALLGSLAASRVFEALLLPTPADSPFARIEGGERTPLPPCAHR